MHGRLDEVIVYRFDIGRYERTWYIAYSSIAGNRRMRDTTSSIVTYWKSDHSSSRSRWGRRMAVSRGSTNGGNFIDEELVQLVRADIVTCVNSTTSDWPPQFTRWWTVVDYTPCPELTFLSSEVADDRRCVYLASEAALSELLEAAAAAAARSKRRVDLNSPTLSIESRIKWARLTSDWTSWRSRIIVISHLTIVQVC